MQKKSPPYAIVLQIYAASFSTPPVLLAILGSWGDTMTDDEVLDIECFIEECAGADSLEFRRALMHDHPKH